MSSRTCDGCYKAISTNEKYCDVCQPGNFTVQWHPRKQIRYYRLKVLRAQKRFDNWVETIQSIPTPHKLLTEEQWHEAVAFFGGCAYCDDESIETRGFFIPFKEGGAYTNWNVVPLCQKCALTATRQSNPFKQMNEYINRNVPTGRGGGMRKLKKLVEFLEPRLNKAAEEGQCTTDSE